MSEQYSVRTISQDEIKNNKIAVSVPGSKSMTNRALLLATLAQGKSILRGVLFSDDSRYFMKCIKELGFEATIDEEKKEVVIVGEGGTVPKKEAGIYVGSAGTAARFLTALLGISKGEYFVDASEQMKKRPMAPLLNGLKTLGTEISYKEAEEHFPFTLRSNGVTADNIAINIDDSSQFLSALLISACIMNRDFRIDVKGKHGMAYIDMTVGMMKEFGIEAVKQTDADGEISYSIKAGQCYQALDYRIEPDLSAACYFYALAMVLGITVTVKHVHNKTMQGDLQLLYVFEKMGATLTETPEGIALTGPKDGFNGIEVDMHSFSDQAITLAAIAPFANTPTRITGIGHIRFQESNRIAAIVNELTKLGIECKELEDGVEIQPGKPHGGDVDTYDDHRMAMGFSLIGLKVPGIVINDPKCCRKTFEDYFEVLEETQRMILN